MDQYQETDRYNRSWIIGFSGGKDSTVLLTLVWIALTRLKESGIPLHRRVYVVCNDTMVENPVIEEYVTYCTANNKEGSKRATITYNSKNYYPTN